MSQCSICNSELKFGNKPLNGSNLKDGNICIPCLKRVSKADKNIALKKGNYTVSDIQAALVGEKCLKCNSTNIYIGKKGYGVGKGVAGFVLFGGIGALFGFRKSKQLQRECLSCGNKW